MASRGLPSAIKGAPFAVSQPAASDQYDALDMLWVRLVGLPFSATETDVLDFISGFAISNPDQVIFSPTRSGRGPDRVFICMISAEEAYHATEALNGRMMKGRYIEARQVALRHVLREVRTGVNALKVTAGATLSENCGNLPMAMTQCVTLVGLPFDCNPQEIFSFLCGLRVRGIHRCGRRNDKCVVELHDVVEAMRAVKRRHKQYLGGRYIEVYAARPCDMQCACQAACVIVPLPQHNTFVSVPVTDSVLPQGPVSERLGRKDYNKQASLYDLRVQESTSLRDTEISTPPPTDVATRSVSFVTESPSNEVDEMDSTSTESVPDPEHITSTSCYVHDPYHLPDIETVEEIPDQEYKDSDEDSNGPYPVNALSWFPSGPAIQQMVPQQFVQLCSYAGSCSCGGAQQGALPHWFNNYARFYPAH